jgi:hypothetical protein
MPPPAPPPGESAPAVKLQATRPPNVPQAAVWVGGPDGGVFVLFEPPPIPGAKATTIRGKVFHSTGEVWFSGTFVPEPPGAAVDLGRERDFLGWDGEKLLLAGNRALRAVARRR